VHTVVTMFSQIKGIIITDIMQRKYQYTVIIYLYL